MAELEYNRYASASLYVGDLESNVSEDQLYDIFNQVGTVVSVRVCRDLITGRSLNYAYVNYTNTREATRALELLNFSHVNGKPMRLMYSHRDPSVRKSGAANIFIKNLDKGIDNKALHDTFAIFGPIISCKVATDSAGQSKGYAFVQFEQEEAAENSIRRLNGMLMNDKQVYVGPFIRRQEREQANVALKFNNVFVKNFSETTTEDDLKNIFSGYGPITSAVVMQDTDGKSKGFGFVNFENAEDAGKAVDNLNGKTFDDREWFVGRAQKKAEREAELRARFEQNRTAKLANYQGANLYLRNLDNFVDDGKLRELFSEFGTISSCKVLRDPQGLSMGSGFVAFFSAQEAAHAVSMMNGKMVGRKPLYVAPAQCKEERRAGPQAQFAQMRASMGIGPSTFTGVPGYHPGSPGLVPQQLFCGQGTHGLLPPWTAGFGYQQQVSAGMHLGSVQMQNFALPYHHQRQGQQGQRIGGRHGGVQPQPHPQQQQQQTQLLQRGVNRGFRYLPNSRNIADCSLLLPDGLMHQMLPMPVDVAGTRQATTPHPVLIAALSSALASATPEQQRAILTQQLFPLVDTLEHDHAGKVTGMLLEMDQTEVLHLIESPDALKAKVGEAMEVLRLAQASAVAAPADQLALLSLNDHLVR